MGIREIPATTGRTPPVLHPALPRQQLRPTTASEVAAALCGDAEGCGRRLAGYADGAHAVEPSRGGACMKMDSCSRAKPSRPVPEQHHL